MRRLVVKVGSSTLTTPDGRLDLCFIERLVEALSGQRREGLDVALVTSGAVAAGADRLRIGRPATVPQKQAAAAVGQGILMGAYGACFDACGLAAAQILLTRGDVADRSGFTNARNTFDALFRLGVVPIVNENDSVAVDELRFGDNDALAAIVALIIDADLAIILSDVEGLYDPNEQPRRTMPVVPKVTPALEALARPAGAGPGTGGMVTKLRAARTLTRAGIPMVIGHGRDIATIEGAVRRWKALGSDENDPGAPGTLFIPAARRLRGRKRWIAFGARVRGLLTINERACEALSRDGRSLLAAGVMNASGHFQAGDLVRILDEEGHEVGRGLVNFSLNEMRLLCGRQSSEISALVGREALTEVIHRDNLVITQVQDP